jgi:putative aldouronate transport system permease protein
MAVRRSRGERVFQLFNYTALSLLCLATVYPFWNLVALSFSGISPVRLHKVFLWPLEFQLDSLRYLFDNPLYWDSFRLTVAITVVGTAANVAMTTLFAYPLAKSYFRWKKPLTLMVVITMFFSGGLIPEYLLYRYLGMLDRFSVYIIPGAISTWSLLILRNFFQQIPESIEDSARIDGASELTILLRIVVPMSMPIIATITLWAAVGKWNTFSHSIFFTSSRAMKTLQVVLRSISLRETSDNYIYQNPRYRNASPDSNTAVAIVFTTLPILLVYPFLQRYFVRGIIIGSLKG